MTPTKTVLEPPIIDGSGDRNIFGRSFRLETHRTSWLEATRNTHWSRSKTFDNVLWYRRKSPITWCSVLVWFDIEGLLYHLWNQSLLSPSSKIYPLWRCQLWPFNIVLEHATPPQVSVFKCSCRKHSPCTLLYVCPAVDQKIWNRTDKTPTRAKDATV